MAETFNPTDHTVAQVNDHLAEHPAGSDAYQDERERVLALEADGEARKGILEGPHAFDGGTPADPAKPEAETSTKGLTFADAAKAATPHPRGYLGTSPEAERTGLADKGLSQQSPAILTGGPVPDPRQGVDDSAALNG